MSANSAMEAIGLLVHAYYEMRDVDATLACVTDSIVWVGTESDDSAHGKAELQKLLEADVAAFSQPFNIELNEPVVKKVSDTVTSIWVTGHQVEVPGVVAGFTIRGTANCVKTAEGWLVDSLHVSVPNTEIEKYSLAKELDENRKKEKMLMAYIPGGVAIYRLEKSGIVKADFISDGLAKMCGYSDTEEFRNYLAENAMVNVVAEDAPAVLQAAQNSLVTHQSISIMYRIHTRDGGDILQRLDANMIDGELGEHDLAVWYAVHTVVSDESKAIIQDQKNLHSLIDEVPTGIGIYEVDHGVARQNYMNNAFYAMLGTDREERSIYNGTNTLQAAHPDDVSIIQAAMESLIKGENLAEITYRLHLHGEQWLWVHMTASVVERRDQYVRIYAAISNYSEIMRVRQELETSRNTLRIALQAAKVFSWRYDYRCSRITDSGTLGEAFNLPKTLDNLPQAIIDMGFVSADSEDDFRRLYVETAMEKTAAVDVLSNVPGEHGLRWFRQIYTPVFDEKGNYTESIGIAMDISDQKHREQIYEDQVRLHQIATQDALSRVSLNLSRNTVSTFDSKDPKYAVHASYHTAAQLLASVREVVGVDTEWKKFEAVSTPARMIETFREGITHVEVTFHTDQGANWLRVTYDMMENPYTGDIEAISAIHDVTESERAKLVMNQLLAIDYESIALIDLKTRKLVPFKSDAADSNLNEVMELQTAMDDGEGGLKAFLQKYAVPGTAEQSIEDNSMETISRELEKAPYYECTYALERNGQRRNYRVFYSYVENDSSVLLCAVQDITEICLREERQREELARALAQAKAASKVKTAFLSRVSHDMRTPLNGILGLTALMKDVVVAPKVMQDLGQLELSGRYLLNLINDTLDVSRIESGNMELHPSVCDSRNVINNVVRLIRPSMDAKGITFTVQAADLPMIPIYIDEGRLQQIAMNILGNAAKFTPDGGRVELTAKNCSFENGIVVDEFLVRDNGIGMSEEFLPHIFESFSQEDDTTTNIHRGTGLGLTITNEIVKLMGGRMEVTSKQGEGTCVKVVLQFPVATQKQIDEWKKSKQPCSTSYHLAGKRVLLCEDHPLNTQIATRLLNKVEVMVEHAENGAVGVKMFAHSKPGYYDAILMDIRMPVMDGLDAAREIRALDRPDAGRIPILAMTANALDEDVRRSCDAGMNAHLSKPISPDNLFRALEQFINPEIVLTKPRVLIVDNIEVNRAVIAASLEDKYEIFEAGSGAEAIRLLREHHGMDVVVTDIQMPNMDGTELIQRIRAEDTYHHIVIIANTQYEQPGQEEFLLSIGANDFIYKPANPKIVEMRIENALRGL